MFIILSGLRWIGAIVVAVIVFVVALAACAFVWKTFGTHPVRTMEIGMASATTFAILFGAHVVAREQRRAAALALWAFAVAAPLYGLGQNLSSGQFSPTNLAELLWTLSGGLLGNYLVRLTVRQQERRRHPSQPVTLS